MCCVCLLGLIDLQCFSVFLFDLLVPCISESRLWLSPVTIVELSISPFNIVNFVSHILGLLLLGAYMFLNGYILYPVVD